MPLGEEGIPKHQTPQRFLKGDHAARPEYTAHFISEGLMLIKSFNGTTDCSCLKIQQTGHLLSRAGVTVTDGTHQDVPSTFM